MYNYCVFELKFYIVNKGGNVARFVNVFDTSSSVTKIWGKINPKNKQLIECGIVYCIAGFKY